MVHGLEAELRLLADEAQREIALVVRADRHVGGKIEFRVDKHANLHFIIGKSSFDEKALVENYAAALDEILRLKPSASKGRYITKATMATTMGPGILIDQSRTRNLMEDGAEQA